MLRRGLLIGGLGLSLTIAGATALTGTPALAQEPASEGADPELSVEEQMAAWEEARQQRYEDFLAKFAENLGVDDPTLVETAFKETLKQLIDEELAAGNIAANDAAAMKERIDAAEGPFLFGALGGSGRHVRILERRHGDIMFGPRGGHGPGGHGIFERRRGPGVWIESAPADDAAGEVESLPVTDESASTPTP